MFCLVIYDASSGIMISIRLSIWSTSRSTACVNWWKSVIIVSQMSPKSYELI